MRHLILCPEYPPAPIPSGGIGTYAVHMAQLLAECGETVHVIAQLCAEAPQPIEEKCQGRLIIHRLPLGGEKKDAPNLSDHSANVAKVLFQSRFPSQCFAWQAGLLAEKLVEEEDIDLIEAQEYDAPLYYFQLRRALGLGPERKPPCFVHLHSPTEFIVKHNGWDLSSPNFLIAKRFEEFSIAAADALLCPSQYLARQAETHYGLAAGRIRVIPLPIGNTPKLERDASTWRSGGICYVGRLERRKGVLEWIDAAVKVAEKYPEAHFEFIGENCLGTYHQVDGIEILERRIPEALKQQFHFWDKQNRSNLPQFLQRCRMAVVPSRWENFPNTCVEAMCSGLPVIASPEGGMAEMVQDGQTGWIANAASPDDLAIALRRALATSSVALAEMGERAALAIRQMCDNATIVQKHLEFRQQIVAQGAKRSLCLPNNLPWAKQPFDNRTARRTAKHSTAEGIAIVVPCFNDGPAIYSCLHSFKNQTKQPIAVVVVDSGSTNQNTLKVLDAIEQDGWQVIRHRAGDRVSAKNLGIASLSEAGINSLGVAFLDARYRLQPSFIATCGAVLQQCSDVGLVSCWSKDDRDQGNIWIKPCPSFPYQWVTNEAAPFSVVRTEALHEAGRFRSVMDQAYEDWDLYNAVMAAGWSAVTVPEVLVEGWVEEDPSLLLPSVHAHGAMRQEILQRFPDLIARDAIEIALFAECNPERSLRQELVTIQGKISVAKQLFYTARTDGLLVLGRVKERILGPYRQIAGRIKKFLLQN